MSLTAFLHSECAGSFMPLQKVDPNYAKVKNVEVTITGNYEDTLTEKWNKFFNVKSTRTFKIPPHVYAVVPRIFG